MCVTEIRTFSLTELCILGVQFAPLTRTVLTLIILLITGGTLIAQRPYLGYGMRFVCFNTISTDYNYLSDSPYTSIPNKIEKPIQLSLAQYTAGIVYTEIGLPVTFDLYFGYQFKRSFFELNAQPLGRRELNIKTVSNGHGSGGIESKYFTCTFTYGSYNFDYKFNYTGRKKVRSSLILGYGVMIPFKYHYEFEDQGGEFFGFENPYYQMARIGLEYYADEKGSAQVRYNYHITNFDPNIRAGYIEFVLRTSIFKKRLNYKRDYIYFDE